MTIITIVTALVVLLAIISIFLSDKGRNFTDFCRLLVSGLDSGFNVHQIFFLAKIGKEAGLEDRSTLFWSSSALDKCTAEIVRQSKNSGTEDDKNVQKILSALYAYRRKMDLEQSRKKRGLITTRDIDAGQHLCIVFSGVGVFFSKVIANSRECLTVDFPRAPSVMATEISWVNKPIKVYFWRVDDASYEFSTRVLPPESDDNRAVLRLTHSEKVIRSQMRKNRRIKCSIPAQLYIIKDDDRATEIESVPGMKCILQDLSDTGAMILIGGKASRGMKIKIQFMIQETLIVMAGTARGVNYNASKNRSLIHFGCNNMDSRMRNEVLSFVYNVLPARKKNASEDFNPAEIENANNESSAEQLDVFSFQENPQAQSELPDFASERHE